MSTQAWPSLEALPGVAAAVESARSAIALVHRHPENRRGWPRTAAAASVRAARASAVLDGGSASIDLTAGSVQDPILNGSLRVAAALGTLLPIWRRAPLQVLARLHTLAAADLCDPAQLGRPRPDSPELPSRLNALAQTILAGPWSGPVMVAVVHGELLALKPFGAADGVVARAAGRLTMIESGLDPHGLTVPEVGHLRSGATYLARAVDFSAGTSGGTAAWIIGVCSALELGAREGSSIADSAADPVEQDFRSSDA